ncbi:hypothetical protein B0H63DRAFT_449486 [Podospora didyma]|uniref:Uncharacterized protein n=1 Tax=Podospora didyma TaxID=330526 RepID=A0AAE0TZU4_9PEZI|nr:hypothetical protein B0H63DRAFT_449486 [Podospora didyma]
MVELGLAILKSQRGLKSMSPSALHTYQKREFPESKLGSEMTERAERFVDGLRSDFPKTYKPNNACVLHINEQNVSNYVTAKEKKDSTNEYRYLFLIAVKVAHQVCHMCMRCHTASSPVPAGQPKEVEHGDIWERFMLGGRLVMFEDLDDFPKKQAGIPFIIMPLRSKYCPDYTKEAKEVSHDFVSRVTSRPLEAIPVPGPEVYNPQHFEPYYAIDKSKESTTLEKLYRYRRNCCDFRTLNQIPRRRSGESSSRDPICDAYGRPKHGPEPKCIRSRYNAKVSEPRPDAITRTPSMSGSTTGAFTDGLLGDETGLTKSDRDLIVSTHKLPTSNHAASEDDHRETWRGDDFARDRSEARSLPRAQSRSREG